VSANYVPADKLSQREGYEAVTASRQQLRCVDSL
jgi:hypothetical protein